MSCNVKKTPVAKKLRLIHCQRYQ